MLGRTTLLVLLWLPLLLLLLLPFLLLECSALLLLLLQWQCLLSLNSEPIEDAIKYPFALVSELGCPTSTTRCSVHSVLPFCCPPLVPRPPPVLSPLPLPLALPLTLSCILLTPLSPSPFHPLHALPAGLRTFLGSFPPCCSNRCLNRPLCPHSCPGCGPSLGNGPLPSLSRSLGSSFGNSPGRFLCRLGLG